MEPLPASVEYLRRVIIWGFDTNAQELYSLHKYLIPDGTSELINDFKDRFTLTELIRNEFKEIELPKKSIELSLAFYLHGFNPKGVLLADGRIFVQQKHLLVPKTLFHRYTTEGFDVLYHALRR